jgi:hypothetical protein
LADAIVGTSYVPIGRRALAKHLLGLAPRLVEATLAAEFDPSVGHQVGDDMVAAHFTGVETLSKTLALIAEELPKLLGFTSARHQRHGRIAQLVGSMAAGYASALRDSPLAVPRPRTLRS